MCLSFFVAVFPYNKERRYILSYLIAPASFLVCSFLVRLSVSALVSFGHLDPNIYLPCLQQHQWRSTQQEEERGDIDGEKDGKKDGETNFERPHLIVHRIIRQRRISPSTDPTSESTTSPEAPESTA